MAPPISRHTNTIHALTEVDGAPAARFMKRLGEILSAGDVVREALA